MGTQLFDLQVPYIAWLCGGLICVPLWFLVLYAGHHAMIHKAQGFCFFNNVAVAAQVARSKYGVKRVCIVDLDVHFGDSTSAVFINDPTVLYISLHRWDRGYFYPHSLLGAPSNVGSHKGRGYNVNIAWNVPASKSCKVTTGDAEYHHAFRTIVLPILIQYQPELILVSAGFDCLKDDPLGGLTVTPQGYASLIRLLMSLCPKIVLALEGGYCTSVLAEASAACVSALLGDPPAKADLGEPNPAAREDVENCKRALSPYWKL
jgi:histone deacetylase 6